MTWLLLALLAPLAWSIANYLDKFILSRVSSDAEGGSGGLLILSALVSVAFALIVAITKGFATLLVTPQISMILLASGFFEAMYIFFYFCALERESATTVVGLFQFAPIFGMGFGYVLLHEIPTGMQFAAMMLILIGTLCIVFKKGEKISLVGGVVGLMLLSTLFVGLYNTLFKFAGSDISFWTAIFWQYLGIGLAGLVSFVARSVYRKQFFGMLTNRGGIVLAATIGAEVMNILAILATNAAILFAPVGIVLSIGSVQPIFVLLEGLALAYFVPTFLGKDEKPRLELRYILGIILVCIGGFFIS